MPSPIILYAENHWDSPYVFTVFVALHEKGLSFEERVLDLEAGEQRAPEFASRSLTQRVPAIEHEGFVLSESLAIAEYLEERFAPPEHPRLFPEALRDRARARQLHGFLRSDLMPLRDERPTSTVFFEPTSVPLTERAKPAVAKLLRVAEAVIPNGEGPLFGSFALADAELALMLARLVANSDEVPERIARYTRSIWDRPSVQAFVTHPRPAKA
jgi:glutathione S-transferase